MKQTVILSILALSICGCTTSSTDPGHPLTSRQRQCLDRVQVMLYDQVQRPHSASVAIYDETRPLDKPVREIAFLTCEGAAKKEIDMTQGMIEKARQLGADAIVILGANMGSDFQMGHGGSRAVFRAKAVVFKP